MTYSSGSIAFAFWVVLGTAVVLLALVDIFYTVLYPGSGRGPVRRPLARVVRSMFGQSRRARPSVRRRLLPYAGPVEVTATLLSWFVLLVSGWATIYFPALGSAVSAANGPTERSWWTALSFSGYNLTTLGLGDVVASAPPYRVGVVVEAGTGFMAFTLAISYFVSVYSTLTRRNTFAMALHDRSGGTGRGSVVVRALWHEGPVGASLHLAAMADGLRELAQTDRSYPVLRSFHYQREYDALPRMLLTSWETVTLLRTTLDAKGCGRPELIGSAVAEIEAAATTMMRLLLGSADADAGAGAEVVPSGQAERWRSHHAQLLAELAADGVPALAGSIDEYLAARSRWDAGLARVADQMLYDWPDDLRPVPGGLRPCGGAAAPSRGSRGRGRRPWSRRRR